MRRSFIMACVSLYWACGLYAAQSTITEAEGTASMGDDKTRKQTEQAALADAKRAAVEQTLTYLRSETVVKDAMLQSDVIDAYANASIRVVQEIKREWYKDEALGDCCRVRIKAEVIPDEQAMAKARDAQPANAPDDPTAPLSVNTWTERKEYKTGEQVKLYLKGNKPFYARVVYTDAAGAMIQLLPNPYRADNYFNGGVTYEMPSGQDRFVLEVSPPYGTESITVYASTAQLGDVKLEAAGGVYTVKTKSADVGNKSRGIRIQEKGSGKPAPAEFSETTATIQTLGQ